MPKPTKLHSKGKSNTIQKTCKIEKDSADGVDPEESVRRFQLELCWCIQQLERTLNEKKGTEKQLQEAWKVLAVLKNNNQPMIRKRQLMRTQFGDYRAKMAAEEKKLVKMATKIKISEVPDKPKATFLRKSAFLTTGNEAFRFNFKLTPEQSDTNNDILTGNTSEECQDIVNKEVASSEIAKEVASTEIAKEVASSEIAKEESGENNLNEFKFSFSNTDFKFNFNINK